MASADLTHELTCPICLEVFTEPVSLECGHHFCRSCISQSWEKVPGDVSCPQCRQVFTQRNTRPARTLGNIVEQLRLLKVKVTQREEEFYCEEHGEKLKMFCEEEQKPICVDCWSSEHQTHNDLHIKEATKIYQGKLEKSLEFLQKQMALAVQSKREGEDGIVQINAQVSTLRNEINTEFEKMHKFLSEKKELMKAELEIKADKILKEMENNLKSIFDEMSSLEGAIRDLKARLEIQEAPELLKDIQALLNRCEIEVHNPGAVSTELPVDIVGGPLKYVKVWREMRAVISPVPVPLTLDPKTAHPRLTVSDNWTRVTNNNQEQLVSDNPKRFNYWPCVLGFEGFISGRHYWEVEVGNNLFWVVGLATESVPRKEKFTLDNISGFWTMAVSQGQYKALTSPRTALSLRMELRKLGVFLDYERGQVSLYNADDMSHLYTFTDTFTEKLYPFLFITNPGESLTLLPSQG